ncbi:hypothetical protein [[Mycoplasma] gypis]|uniref:Ribosome maturation factor RimP n=1 Tax=[Mycoplasma] gypis TaxID=92404 RepID=A0ABZ2RQR8_9BACT|nr:hypothetical protein [[Mycoplasma] gypis]MBN0919583.1 hypothetical protein [[Mycoplasma] gypis]
MDLVTKIKENFSTEISKIYWEKNEDGKFLKIELKSHDFEFITEISQKINTIVDLYDEGEFCLDIYSSGIDLNLTKADLSEYIEQKIALKLSKPYKDEYEIVIKLLEIKENGLFGIKNNKGRMQKILVLDTDILEIQKVIDIKK